MDLVFKRYSSPFLLLNTLIEQKQLLEFINELDNIVYEERIYKLWLHKGYMTNYNDFKAQCGFKDNDSNINTPFDVNDVLEASMSVLEDIQP